MMKSQQEHVLTDAMQRLTTAITMLTPTLSSRDMTYLVTLLANVQHDLKDMVVLAKGAQ